MKIFDCFMYFDEEVVLNVRLNTLDKFVDYFVIVESRFTHKGDPRELKFDHKKFQKFKDKIVDKLAPSIGKDVADMIARQIKKNNPKTIALILAGNLPMVGFHDLICVFISGHNALVKCASKDLYLLPYMTQFLEHEIGEICFSYTKEVLSNFDAVIATGSNNAARYFDHYFSNYPNIIRKNRNGIAILSGKETSKEFDLLGKDILQCQPHQCEPILTYL